MINRLFVCLVASLALTGCAEVVLLATATLGSPTGQTVAVTPGGVPVRVTVQDQRGKPVSSATVFAYPEGKEHPAIELSPGEYALESLPTGSPINFEVFKDGYTVGNGALTPLKDASNTLDVQVVQLVPVQIAYYAVVDLTVKPLANVMVQADSVSNVPPYSFSGQTDQNGKLALDNVPAGASIRLISDKSGFPRDTRIVGPFPLDSDFSQKNALDIELKL